MSAVDGREWARAETERLLFPLDIFVWLTLQTPHHGDFLPELSGRPVRDHV